jgi:hypothetical protein
MSNENNLSLWNKVQHTDPAYVKSASNGRFTFSTIDPQYQLQEATKLWGCYGHRWGLRELKWTIFPTEPPTLMMEAEFFYPAEISRADGVVLSHASFPIAVDMRLKPGDDCCKKLMTSARSKALSYLGFSADIFLGKFDDSQYVDEQKIRFGDMNAFGVKALSKIRTSKTAAELDKCRERTDEMIAHETITASVGADLLNAIEQRRAELST